MFIRAYLRASTDEQDATRAKQSLIDFAESKNCKIASFYIENFSGAKLERPELNRLLADSHRNDILLIEQIDRLTRLNESDWENLKRQISDHGLTIVTLDLHTTHQAMTGDDGKSDDVTRGLLKAISTMLIDVMALMARKDFITRQERQRQGIERAKAAGLFKGRAADTARHERVIYHREVAKLSYTKIAEVTGYSRAQVMRIVKAYNEGKDNELDE